MGCKSENNIGAKNLYGHRIGRTASYGPVNKLIRYLYKHDRSGDNYINIILPKVN